MDKYIHARIKGKGYTTKGDAAFAAFGLGLMSCLADGLVKPDLNGMNQPLENINPNTAFNFKQPNNKLMRMLSRGLREIAVGLQKAFLEDNANRYEAPIFIDVMSVFLSYYQANYTDYSAGHTDLHKIKDLRLQIKAAAQLAKSNTKQLQALINKQLEDEAIRDCVMTSIKIGEETIAEQLDEDFKSKLFAVIDSTDLILTKLTKTELDRIVDTTIAKVWNEEFVIHSSKQDFANKLIQRIETERLKKFIFNELFTKGPQAERTFSDDSIVGRHLQLRGQPGSRVTRDDLIQLAKHFKTSLVINGKPVYTQNETDHVIRLANPKGNRWVSLINPFKVASRKLFPEAPHGFRYKKYATTSTLTRQEIVQVLSGYTHNNSKAKRIFSLSWKHNHIKLVKEIIKKCNEDIDGPSKPILDLIDQRLNERTIKKNSDGDYKTVRELINPKGALAPRLNYLFSRQQAMTQVPQLRRESLDRQAIIKLLQGYLNRTSTRRFFKGHWNHHHVQLAKEIIKACELEPNGSVQPIRNFIERQIAILPDDKRKIGSFDRVMRRIREASLPPYENSDEERPEESNRKLSRGKTRIY